MVQKPILESIKIGMDVSSHDLVMCNINVRKRHEKDEFLESRNYFPTEICPLGTVPPLSGESHRERKVETLRCTESCIKK